MAWRKRISIELQDLKSLTLKEHRVMYVASHSDVGYGLIQGNLGTSYENGFYIIKFIIPKEYPFKPPECYHISISGTRQSPNFHDTDPGDGKVCISRLNTWEGSTPGKDRWTPSMTIRSILDMIKLQVLTPKALDNEPDYRHSIEDPVNAENYEKFIRFHNFRSNVVDIYTKAKVPDAVRQQFSKAIMKSVLDNYEWYIDKMQQYSKEDNGMYINCKTYTNSCCLCDYDTLIDDFKLTYGAGVGHSHSPISPSSVNSPTA